MEQEIIQLFQDGCWNTVGYVIIALAIAGFLGLIYRKIKTYYCRQ